MIGQLSSLVGDEVGTRVYGLLNRVQMWRICAVFFSGFSSSCVCSARYGATVARLRRIFFIFPSPLPGRGRLPRRAQRRYGATVAHLRRIFFRFASSCLTRIGEEVVPSLF